MGMKTTTEMLMKLWILAGEKTIAITPGADEEDHHRQRHGNTGNSEAQAPANLLLDVIHDQEGEYHAAVHPKVPPVEEGAPGLAFLGIVLVELICSEGLHAGLVPSLRDCRQVQREEEEDGLVLRGKTALEVDVGAPFREMDGRETTMTVQKLIRASEGTNQDVQEGGDDDGAVPPDVGVGEGAAKEGEHHGHAAPGVYVGGGGGGGLLERSRQVGDEVRRDP
ncbi:unnamed protein product [Spirodela intermedia]|uniref:Uncharacterized protein n=1 Tax=Spirodela intermedia TaxID=51605 RepID=A0A7I8IRV8_SPIIN|nr:unnamed protein product [Spirodela intermedia]CAA6660484.1 unnamed protein product [Spirodela intermedia]